MINLNKETEKKEKQSNNTIIWSLLIFIALMGYTAFCGWAGYTSGSKEVSELATKINNAYESNYDIFIDGVKVQSIPEDVLKEYEMYNFLFDDIGRNVCINNKHTHYNGNLNNIENTDGNNSNMTDSQKNESNWHKILRRLRRYRRCYQK